eukprot:GILK01003703.1.p1 GENE.GILK01003703.1~~GILK01003703.1.p1  ORF type:complete len:886 (-),score=146.11 GILK01003703.1:435-3092(-)
MARVNLKENENELIGSILAEEAEVHDGVNSVSGALLLDKYERARLQRSTSAPPSVTDDLSKYPWLDNISPNDPRLDPNYYAYYYSQRPLDPRLPPPLFNLPAWRYAQIVQNTSGAAGRSASGSVDDHGLNEAESRYQRDGPPDHHDSRPPRPEMANSSAAQFQANGSEWLKSGAPQRPVAQNLAPGPVGDSRGETLVDKIQSDFPRTPSPVYQTTRSGVIATVQGAQPRPTYNEIANGEAGAGAGRAHGYGDPAAVAAQMVAVQQAATAMQNLSLEAAAAAAAVQAHANNMHPSQHHGSHRGSHYDNRDRDRDRHASSASSSSHSQYPSHPRHGHGQSDRRYDHADHGRYAPLERLPEEFEANKMGGDLSQANRFHAMNAYGPMNPMNAPMNPMQYMHYVNSLPIPPHMFSPYYLAAAGMPVNPMMAAMGYGQGPPPPTDPRDPRMYAGAGGGHRGMVNQDMHRGGPRNRADDMGPRHNDKRNSRMDRDKDRMDRMDRDRSDRRGNGRDGVRDRSRDMDRESRDRDRSNSRADSSPSPPRSTLLEEFRTKNRKLELRDIAGHVVEFSQDQHGSRLIQSKLETCTDPEKQMVFDEILGDALRLMTDVFGNYVIQKFFEHVGTPEQQRVLATHLEGHVLPLSLQMYGCRVVQKALEVIGPDQQATLVQELRNHVLKCVEDQNGNHVIQKCIEKVAPEHIQFIIDAFDNTSIYEMSVHPYGCRVIQRILEYCPPYQSDRVLHEILRCTLNLAQDQYGNYVIQHILERGDKQDKDFIMNKVRGQLMSLSMHKFASNVVEKVLSHANPDEQQDMLKEIIGNREEPIPPLLTMMRDRYANYVVQKALEVSQGEQREYMLSIIKDQIPHLKKFTYGRHIVACVEKVTGKLAM